MSAPIVVPPEEYFLHEVARLADQGRAFLQMIQVHEEALDAESVLFDGVDTKHSSDCANKADEVRSRKRLHHELNSALDGFIQSTQRLKQARLRSHVKQSLLARNSDRNKEIVVKAEPRASQNPITIDNILDSIYVDSPVSE